MCGANWIDGRRPSCIWPRKATVRCRGSSADVVVITGIGGDGSGDEVSEDGERLIERPAAAGLSLVCWWERKPNTRWVPQECRDLSTCCIIITGPTTKTFAP